MTNNPSIIRFVITGGSGRITNALIPMLLSGLIFGPEVQIHLTLLDKPSNEDKLKGVRMEIEDSNYPCLDTLITTTNMNEAFINADVVVLLGGARRTAGMQRKDLLFKNAENIHAQALVLNETASPNVKVLVVVNPANTLCLVAMKAASRIPKENFTCLTRLDEERLRNFCKQKLSQTIVGGKKVLDNQISNVFILGNHSATQVVHIKDGIYMSPDQDDNYQSHKVLDLFKGNDYKSLLSSVQNRGAEIIKATQASSATSAASAIVKHLRDWIGPVTSTNAKEPFSMGICSKGNPFGVDEDLVFSFPCLRLHNNPFTYQMYQGVTFDSEIRKLVKITEYELQRERAEVEGYLHSMEIKSNCKLWW